MSTPVWKPASDFQRQTSAWWEGKRVRLAKDITTRGGNSYRKGRIAYVTKKYGGLNIRGRSGEIYVRRVGFNSLEVQTNWP